MPASPPPASRRPDPPSAPAPAGGSPGARDRDSGPALEARLERTRSLARRLHAAGRAREVRGAYLARGAEGLPPVARSLAALAGVPDLAARLDGGDLVLSAEGWRWRLRGVGRQRFLDRALLSLLDRVLADLGRDERLAWAPTEPPYVVVAPARRIEAWRREGLLLLSGPPLHVAASPGNEEAVLSTEPEPDDDALAADAARRAGRPDALDALAHGIRQALAGQGRLRLAGFGAFEDGAGGARFDPDPGLERLVAEGGPVEEPFPVAAPLGGLAPSEVGEVLAAIADALAAGPGAARLPGLCTLRVRVLPATVTRNPRTGERRLRPERTAIAADCGDAR